MGLNALAFSVVAQFDVHGPEPNEYIMLTSTEKPLMRSLSDWWTIRDINIL